MTEADDHLFCLITMNHHPLHINDVYAAQSQQGRNVVVGPLVYSLALGMSVSDVSGKAIANLATEELKHPAPVFHGDTLFVESEVLEKRESQSKPDRGTVKVHTRVHNQDGVLVAEFKRLVLVPRREAGRPPVAWTGPAATSNKRRALRRQLPVRVGPRRGMEANTGVAMELFLDPIPPAAGSARRALHSAAIFDAAAEPDALLLVSELVTNSIVHAGHSGSDAIRVRGGEPWLHDARRGLRSGPWRDHAGHAARAASVRHRRAWPAARRRAFGPLGHGHVRARHVCLVRTRGVMRSSGRIPWSPSI